MPSTRRRAWSPSLLVALLGCAGGLAAVVSAATPPPAWPVIASAVPRDAALAVAASGESR